MFGLGFGRDPRLRYLRIGLLLVLLAAAFLFHHNSSAYGAIRIVYYVAILGLLAWGTLMRRRGRGTVPNPPPSPLSPPPEHWAADPAPSGAGATVASSAATPGWYREPGSVERERYWDGQSWGAYRRWDGTGWVPEG